jgi:hypothetical protein
MKYKFYYMLDWGNNWMKKLKNMSLIIIIILLIGIVIQYRNNEKIKAQHGNLVEYKISWLQKNLKSVSEQLSSTKIPQKEYIDQTRVKFSEDIVLLNGIMYSPMPLAYLDMIRIDLDRMSRSINDKKSEEELIATKQLALDKLAVLLNEINYIMDSCKTNRIKYYELSKPNNPIMLKVDRAMIDYLNKNNIQ